MIIRPFQKSDLDAILKLFYKTVHTTNIHDYSREQLEAWAPKDLDANRWLQKLQKSLLFVAEQNGEIVGFANLTYNGHLDHLYVHKNWQRQGIASALLKKILQQTNKLELDNITTESSITAKPFFEKHRFKILQENKKERRGQTFKTYLMEKIL